MIYLVLQSDGCFLQNGESNAVFSQVDEIRCDVNPVVVLETLNLARYVTSLST